MLGRFFSGAMSGGGQGAGAPIACVIGDLSMVRALGIEGIPVAFVTDQRPGRVAFSRYCKTVVRTPSWVDQPAAAIDRLIEWGRAQPERPVLFYQGDHDLIAVSRARDRLATHFRFVLPPSEVVDVCVSKLAFAERCETLGLPVPASLPLLRGRANDDALAAWSHFPCVLKPMMRTHWYERIGIQQKALRFDTRDALCEWLENVGRGEQDFLLQAAIAGGEDRIVSYHAYVRKGGEIVAEFTGRKVRTSPALYGLSSLVEITADPRVRDLGRRVVGELEFSGVLKIDFKEDESSGELYMLEINPRFNLWHHPGAVAGVNIPAMVYRDCLNQEAGAVVGELRDGVRWMELWLDFRAYREQRRQGGLTFARWLGEVVSVDVNEGWNRRDPLPALAELAEKAGKGVRWLLDRGRAEGGGR